MALSRAREAHRTAPTRAAIPASFLPLPEPAQAGVSSRTTHTLLRSKNAMQRPQGTHAVAAPPHAELARMKKPRRSGAKSVGVNRKSGKGGPNPDSSTVAPTALRAIGSAAQES